MVKVPNYRQTQNYKILLNGPSNLLQPNLGPVNLAGHSMGSLITTGVSVTRPDLVKRMAVLNGV